MKLGFLRDILKDKDPDWEIAFDAHGSSGNSDNWSDLNTISVAPPNIGLPHVLVFSVGRPWPRQTDSSQGYGYCRGEDIKQDDPDGRP